MCRGPRIRRQAGGGGVQGISCGSAGISIAYGIAGDFVWYRCATVVSLNGECTAISRPNCLDFRRRLILLLLLGRDSVA